MTHTQLRDRYTKIVAAAIGACIVIALIAVAQPAGGHGGILPASLSFSATQDGAVSVSPAAPKPLLQTGPLRPGDRAGGRFVVRNQTGERLDVRLRATPSSTALDGIAQVRLASAGRTIAETTLQALRAGSEGALALAPGAAAVVAITVSIPAEIESGYEGSNVAVSLAPVHGEGR